jgi:hypothetical protein
MGPLARPDRLIAQRRNVLQLEGITVAGVGGQILPQVRYMIAGSPWKLVNGWVGQLDDRDYISFENR